MYKILMVDDEPGILKVLERFFGKKGFEVVAASGGDEALEIINSRDGIDLMILDIKMPKMNGIEVVKRMKKNDGRIPVIFLTGSIGFAQYLKDLEPLGYNRDDILFKPIDLNEILKIVNKKLGV